MRISKRPTFVLLLLLAVIASTVAGCGQSAVSFGLQSDTISSAEVTRTLRYVQGLREGPPYEIGLTVPEEWVGSFVSNQAGNVVRFDYVDETERQFPIFTIEALSAEQYWQQQGSYPAQRVTLRSTPDTYFVYHVLEEAYYSGLPKSEFQPLAEQVPDVMTTFDIFN